MTMEWRNHTIETSMLEVDNHSLGVLKEGEAVIMQSRDISTQSLHAEDVQLHESCDVGPSAKNTR